MKTRLDLDASRQNNTFISVAYIKTQLDLDASRRSSTHVVTRCKHSLLVVLAINRMCDLDSMSLPQQTTVFGKGIGGHEAERQIW